MPDWLLPSFRLSVQWVLKALESRRGASISEKKWQIFGGMPNICYFCTEYKLKAEDIEWS
jgi:hypothetical protein